MREKLLGKIAIKTPELRSIPVDREMTDTIMKALCLAEQEQQLELDGKEAAAKRVVRVLNVVYPNVVGQYRAHEWVADIIGK